MQEGALSLPRSFPAPCDTDCVPEGDLCPLPQPGVTVGPPPSSTRRAGTEQGLQKEQGLFLDLNPKTTRWGLGTHPQESGTEEKGLLPSLPSPSSKTSQTFAAHRRLGRAKTKHILLTLLLQETERGCQRVHPTLSRRLSTLPSTPKRCHSPHHPPPSWQEGVAAVRGRRWPSRSCR